MKVSNEQNSIHHWSGYCGDGCRSSTNERDRVWGRCRDRNVGDRADRCIGQVKHKTDALTQIRQRRKGALEERWLNPEG